MPHRGAPTGSKAIERITGRAHRQNPFMHRRICIRIMRYQSKAGEMTTGLGIHLRDEVEKFLDGVRAASCEAGMFPPPTAHPSPAAE